MKAIKFITAIKLLIVLIVLVLIAGIAWWIKSSDEADNVTMHRATIKEVKTMVQLCAMEIYEDIPVKAHIGKKHIFARQRLRGTISFDLEKLDVDTLGDTLRVVLPPEIIEVYESTDPDSYRVIDTWNESFLGSNKFTAAEENSIKAKVKDQWMRRQYARGTVRQARHEAMINLRDMLATIHGGPVRVVDPAPNGYPKSKGQ